MPIVACLKTITMYSVSSMLCRTCAKDTTPESRMDTVTTGAAIGAGVAASAVCATLPFLLAAGFGPAGIIAGSWAAGVQGSAVAAGSIFASCQSIAATGIAWTTAAGIVATGGVVGGVAGKAADKANSHRVCEKCEAERN